MRNQRVSRMVRAAGDGDGGVMHLCVMAVDTLAVSGAGVSMTDGPGQHSKIAATDAISDRIEDLQVLLGQGPCVDAVSMAEPVLVDDLADSRVAARWPMFTPAAAELGVRASFALPLLVGDLRLGAMDLYRDVVGPLQPTQLEEAEDYASAVVSVLLARQQRSPSDTAERVTASSSVYQATGMVMVQLGMDGEAAFAALRARAYQEGRTLAEVALDVIERRIRFADEEA